MNFFFVRHAESYKSVESRHGGQGRPLTEQGKADVAEIITFLENIENVKFDNTTINCSDRIQVLETAKLMADKKQVPYVVENSLRNIYLGVLDGLSDSEAFEKYPTIAANLQKWRNGLIDLDDVSIPNSETMEDFYSRIYRFISSLTLHEKDVVIIGTRSVGVAIANIFDNYSNKIEKSLYKRYKFDPSSISKFTFVDNKSKIEYINKTDFLSVKPHYQDN